MEKNLKEKFVIIIFGPTAVGKSAFAERLAQNLHHAQIVNCDLGQFYTELSIGVAKPDYKSSSIKQHLFDILSQPKDFNVSQYREAVFNKINQIWQNNDVPVLVGGSGFYLKSLFLPPATDAELGENNIEENNIKKIDDILDENLWNFLYEIDPDRAQKIDKNDIYRIKRAIDLWAKTGRKPSEFMPKFDFPSKFLFIFLNKDRSKLYAQIDMRTDQMIQEGWISEVESLMRLENGKEWENFLKKKKLIGYDLIIDYLSNNNFLKNKKLGIKDGREFEELLALIKKKTKNYAKRQITFWRSLERQLKKEVEKNKYTNKVETRIEEFNIDKELEIDLYINELLIYLKPLFDM